MASLSFSLGKDARSWSRGIIGMSGGAATRSVVVPGCCHACMPPVGSPAQNTRKYARRLIGEPLKRARDFEQSQHNLPERVTCIRSPRDALSTRSPPAFAIDRVGM